MKSFLMSGRAFGYLLGILTVTVVGVSCGPSAGERSPDRLPPGFTDAGRLVLEEVVAIGETSGALLGGIGGVVANEDGTIFVADPENQHIRVFSADGDSLTTIGRKGQGPGEFQGLYQLYLTNNDSIIAFDRRSRQLNVFAPERPFSFVRTVSVPRPEGGFPTRILKPDTAGYFVVYYQPFAAQEDGLFTPGRWISRLGANGDVLQDSIMTVPGKEGILSSSSDFRAFVTRPFGKGPKFARGPGSTIFYGQTDSLRVDQYGAGGQKLRTVRLPYEPIPVTGEDIDSVLAEQSDRFRKMLEQIDFSARRPAFRELAGDEKGRVWIDVIDDSSSDTTAWKIVDMRAREVAETELPTNVSIRYIRGGKLYGTRTDERGLEEVVVYEIVHPQV